MRYYWQFVAAMLFVVICGVTVSWAETRYISDQLIVSLREQPQQGAQSLTYLRTDAAVEVIAEAGDYFKVQTTAGETGYIKKNYLTEALPKSIVIQQLQRERDRLAEKAGNMQQQVATATSQTEKTRQELVTQLEELRKQLSTLEERLQKSDAELIRTRQSYQALQKDAGNVVNISKERNELRQTNQELTAAIAKLDEEVTSLTKTGVIKWFLAGSGVLLLGWIIGKMSGGGRRRNLY